MGGSAPAGSMEPSTTGQGRGLVRLEMDRAVNAFEESTGTSTLGAENARLLAEEVTSVAFRYQFRMRPRWLAWLLEPLARRWFSWETRKRVLALQAALRK